MIKIQPGYTLFLNTSEISNDCTKSIKNEGVKIYLFDSNHSSITLLEITIQARSESHFLLPSTKIYLELVKQWLFESIAWDFKKGTKPFLSKICNSCLEAY